MTARGRTTGRSSSGPAACDTWVTPATRDRTLVTSSATLRRVVARLDWLHRFRIQPPTDAASATESRGATIVVDRDGSVRHGSDASLTAMSRLPALFPFIAPMLAARRASTALANRRRGPASGSA